MGRIVRCRFVLPPPHPRVAISDIDQLELHGERAHDPSQLLHAHDVDPSPQPLFPFGVVFEAQAPANEPDLFLGLEEVLALLLDQDPTKYAPEEVDVPPQRLVFGLEADPRREVSAPRTWHRRRCAADIHGR